MRLLKSPWIELASQAARVPLLWRGFMSGTKLRSTSLRLISLAFAIMFFGFPTPGQPRQTGSPGDIALPEKLSLLSELEGLGARAKQLHKPLARAMAEAEVGEASGSNGRDHAQHAVHA